MAIVGLGSKELDCLRGRLSMPVMSDLAPCGPDKDGTGMSFSLEPWLLFLPRYGSTRAEGDGMHVLRTNDVGFRAFAPSGPV